LRSADILSFEDQVATKVVEGLKVEITPAEQKAIEQRPTTNVEAYNEYLQARSLFNQYLVESRFDILHKGQKAALRATELDPNFSDAFAVLAQLYAFEGANSVEGGAELLKKAEAAAQQALKINPQSAEGLIALGGIYSELGHEADAIRTMRRVLVLAPNSELAWGISGYSYYYAGLNQLAERAYGHMIQMNPAALQPHWMHARMLNYQGRTQEAEQEMRQLLASHPDQFKVLTQLGEFLYYEGKLDEAAQTLDRAVQLQAGSSDEGALFLAGIVHAARREPQKIDPRLLRYRPEQLTDGDYAYYLGGIYALLGNREQALVWLKRTVELGDVNYEWFQRDKNYDSLRGDPRYQAIMAGVKQRWEAYKKEFDTTQ
jgi:tetratricopeptide (TPR) repeat protein